MGNSSLSSPPLYLLRSSPQKCQEPTSFFEFSIKIDIPISKRSCNIFRRACSFILYLVHFYLLPFLTLIPCLDTELHLFIPLPCERFSFFVLVSISNVLENL